MGASSHAGAGGTSSILDQQPRSLTEMISDRLSYRPYALLSSRVQSPSAAESNATSRGTGNLARAAQQAAERIRELSESMDRYPLGIFDSSMSSDWPPSGRSTSSALPPASAGPRPSTLGSISRLSGTDAASRPPPLRDFARLRERTSRLHAESAALLERSGAAALAFPPPPPALPSPPIFSGAHLDERAAGGAPRSPFVDPLNPAVYRPIYSGPAESAIDVDEDREDMIGRRGRTGASAISSLAGGTTHQPPPATAPQRPSTSTTTATHLNSTAMTLPPHLIATATPHQPRLADVIEEVLSRATTTSPPLPGYDASAESSSSFAPALGATFSPLVLPARSAAEPSISTPPSSSNPFTSFQAPAPRLPSQTSVPSAPAIQVTSQHTSLWSTLSDAANLALSLSPPLPAATHTGSNVSLGSTAVSLQPSPPLAATASPSLGQRRPPNFSPGFGPLRRVSSPRVIPGIGMGVPPPALPIGGAELPPAVVDPIGAGASSVGASVNSARARGERVSVTGLGRRLSSNK
ncbi:hypothetical protein BC830DRAFT_745593 [Chytriomyces sp. MP71]|nr:hypothetical protein BC830DRAFT_745593 [Chytriomyces sp. MP71]